MIKIDLLFTKGNEEVRLSELGLQVNDVEATSPSLDVDFRTIKNRSGRISAGTQFIEKNINVTGTFYASGILLYEELLDQLNALLVDEDAYYITKMIPKNRDLYGYEEPSTTTGDINLLAIPHTPYKYRYKVFCEHGIEPSFLGSSAAGLLFRFSIYFTTAELPFGETDAKNITVTGSTIDYKGTAKNSQLEHPWILRMTADSIQPGTFTVKIQDRVFRHTSETSLAIGDIFLLKGIETTKNKKNVNAFTNYENFELQPTISKKNTFETTFKGKIELLNFKEFYK